MTTTKKKSKRQTASKRRRTTFSLDAPAAARVILAGDFNGWDARRHPMRKKADGRWEKCVMLSPGRYEYKFLVDGKWETAEGDEYAQLSTNCYGTCNHVIEIKQG